MGKTKYNPKSQKNLKPFPKGVSGNPAGYTNPLKISQTKMNRAEHAELANLILKGSVAELEKMAKDPTSSVVSVMVASLAVRVIRRGDTTAYETLLNRLIGPVKQEVKFSGNGGFAPQVIVSLPSNGREVHTVKAIDVTPKEPNGKPD